MTARLVTIPISHFCEKARWALDRTGVAYVEERHVQLVHVLAARRAGGGRTVPVLVTPGGEALASSSAIVRWADAHLAPERRLYPEGAAGERAAALEARFDAGLGPDGRLWMYHETLPAVRGLEPWVLAGVPRRERAFFRVARGVVEPAIRRYLGVDPDAAAAALVRVEAVFDEVGAQLDDGRRFLLGDRFTAADLAFAALSAPVLVPERYGSPLPPPAALPERMAREVARLRRHPAGAYAARLYEEERPRVTASTLSPRPTARRRRPRRRRPGP